MNSEVKKMEITEQVADPTPLGLFGLGVVSFVVSTQRLGWSGGTSLIVPWAILLGSFAQLIASYFDFKKNNAFGSSVFGVYGLFWSAMAMVWLIVSGAELKGSIDMAQLGFAFIGFFIFSVFGTIAALETNKVVFAIMFLIDILFLGLTLYFFKVGGTWAFQMAAWAELFIPLLGFYGAGASLVNRVAGKSIFPMGKYFGILK